VKALVSLLILSSIGLAQEAPKARIITFSPTDPQHCRVVLHDGKPMLETTYDGTSVAVTMPEKISSGFSLFVRISHEGKGRVEVIPEKLTAIYSDPNHTRFQFFDVTRGFDVTRESEKSQKDEQKIKAAPWESQHPRAAMPDGSVWASMPTIGDGASRWTEEGGISTVGGIPTNSAHPSSFLRRTVLHQRDKVEGIVCLQKATGADVGASPTGMLDEIDIPVGGVTFRF